MDDIDLFYDYGDNPKRYGKRNETSNEGKLRRNRTMSSGLRFMKSNKQVYPKKKNLNLIANMARKHVLQELLHSVTSPRAHRRIYRGVMLGEYDDMVDLYLDEVAEEVKAKIKEHRYWKF